MKHHYDTWTNSRKNLGGIARITIAPDESYSKCTRCGVDVKLGKVGGYKFWVNGRWTSKRPECKGKV